MQNEKERKSEKKRKQKNMNPAEKKKENLNHVVIWKIHCFGKGIQCLEGNRATKGWDDVAWRMHCPNSIRNSSKKNVNPVAV